MSFEACERWRQDTAMGLPIPLQIPQPKSYRNFSVMSRFRAASQSLRSHLELEQYCQPADLLLENFEAVYKDFARPFVPGAVGFRAFEGVSSDGCSG